ncbi:MAG: xylulokinase [Parvibaculales bacterium]
MSYFLGIDLGASSLKACLINQDGQRVAMARAPIETHHPHPRWAEQNPQDWATAMAQALTSLAEDGHALQLVQAISFSGGAHIAILCDGAAAPLRPAIMWSDQRAADEAAELAADSTVEQLSGNRPNPTWTLPQLRWLATHEADVIQATEKLFFAKDWLRFQLTDRHSSDATEVVGGMLGDKHGQWAAPLRALSGLDIDCFPPLLAAQAQAGTVTPQAAAQFGLPVDCPVYQGAIDTSVEWLCAAPQSANMASLKLASAGVLAFTTAATDNFPPVSLYPHSIEPWHYHAAGMSDCMGAIDWVRHNLTPHYDAPAFAAAAKSAPLGANGLLFYPYLSGARAPFWDASLTAEMTGLTRGHTAADIARAAFEGVGHVLTAIWHDMTGRLGSKPDMLHVLGGGGQIGFFCHMLADMLDTPLMAAQESDCAFATALLAATAHGAFSDLSQAAAAAHTPLRQFTPDKQNHARYAARHRDFMKRH